jgi:hypothetical protein
MHSLPAFSTPMPRECEAKAINHNDHRAPTSLAFGQPFFHHWLEHIKPTLKTQMRNQAMNIRKLLGRFSLGIALSGGLIGACENSTSMAQEIKPSTQPQYIQWESPAKSNSDPRVPTALKSRPLQMQVSVAQNPSQNGLTQNEATVPRFEPTQQGSVSNRRSPVQDLPRESISDQNRPFRTVAQETAAANSSVDPGSQQSPEPSRAEIASDATTQGYETIRSQMLSKPINEISLDIHDHAENQPENLGAKIFGNEPAPNFELEWPTRIVTWEPANMFYCPLYFEDVPLERYGHTASPFIQPFVSAARFGTDVLILPRKWFVQPPFSCVSPTGYCTPGNCVPYTFERKLR